MKLSILVPVALIMLAGCAEISQSGDPDECVVTGEQNQSSGPVAPEEGQRSSDGDMPPPAPAPC